MCNRIYKVLTLGLERISILLVKCFPLGSVSATAYRCCRECEASPPQHEWKKHVRTAAKLREWCTTSTPVLLHFTQHSPDAFYEDSSIDCDVFSEKQVCWKGHEVMTESGSLLQCWPFNFNNFPPHRCTSRTYHLLYTIWLNEIMMNIKKAKIKEEGFKACSACGVHSI